MTILESVIAYAEAVDADFGCGYDLLVVEPTGTRVNCRVEHFEGQPCILKVNDIKGSYPIDAPYFPSEASTIIVIWGEPLHFRHRATPTT